MSTELSLTILSISLLSIGITLLLPIAVQGLKALPRARIAGIVLTCICMAWTCWTLRTHPVDFLAFLTPGKLLISGLILTPLICIFLNNLLCARALGGIMMLWPMPIILATRDYVTCWRLVPITIGYISLTLGMFAVFHPWMVRVACEILSERPRLRAITAATFILAGCLCIVTIFTLGKVIGQ